MEQEFWIQGKDGRRRKAKQSICTTCEKVFLQRLNGDYSFCSPSCAMKARKNKVNLTCANCHKSFERTKSKMGSASHGFHFCSRLCKEFAQSLKGSIEEIRPPHYGNGNKQELIWEFFEERFKDGCEDCKEKQKYLLQVHHKDGDKNNNDRSNLELVCANCHIKRHLVSKNGEWIYWTMALTPREFLQNLPLPYSTNE